MKSEIRKGRRLIIITVVILLLLGTILAFLDWHNVRQLIGEAKWALTLVALSFIVATYFCLSAGFVVVSRIFGIKISKLVLFEVGYVSTTLNNLLAFLGVAGHSLRLMLMKGKGVTAGQVFAASLLHSHLHNTVMFCLLPTGLIYLLVRHSVQGSTAFELGLATGILTSFIVIATVFIFVRSLRLAVTRTVAALSRFTIRKEIGPFLDTFNESIALAMTSVKNHPPAAVLALAFAIAEWAFTLVALWFCFDALGDTLSIGVLITGFAIGIIAGNLSMLPGGLGVQEASMAGIYALLGVSLEKAVLASILFRVVCDFIPFFVSFLLYHRLLQNV
jgi:uncharacterized protein (TIRG00374 family)